MGLFDKKESVSRDELRGSFRRDRGIVKGGKGRFSYAQRDRIAHESFGSKKEGEVSKSDYKKVVSDLELKKSRSICFTPKTRHQTKIELR